MDTPPVVAQQPPHGKSRRSFLGVLLGLASTTVGVLLAVPVLRYLLYPLTARSQPGAWSSAGPLSDANASTAPLSRTLQIEELDGWRVTQRSPTVYLIKSGGAVQALSAVCPHLGCTLPWDWTQNAFVCPCHGGEFGADGSYRSGPPRRGMDALETKVVNGSVMVKYQTFRPDVPDKEVTS